MKRIAYIDCQSGISGDMFLGALVDAGVSLKELEKGLSKLRLKGYKLSAKRVKRRGFRATKVDVEIQGARGRRQEAKTWRDVKKTIEVSKLPDRIKQKGLRIFRRLFQAEAKVHGKGFERVHLHELGAVDCMVDIFGTLIGLALLGIEEIYSSPLNLGRGFIDSEHGRIPVPGPATLELLKGKPVYSTDLSFELTTPTGALLISSLARGFGSIPLINVNCTGIGAGSMDFNEQPNILRIIIGEKIRDQQEEIIVIETNIDDMNPQAYEYVMDRLFKAGALDVSLTNVIMKKGRPGVKLTVLCPQEYMDELIRLIFMETTTIGLRFYGAGRKILKRKTEVVETRFGRVGVKVSWLGDEIIRVSPEYRDCLRIAKRLGMPLLDVMREITSFLTADSYKEG
jgi:hypothetical protein